METETPSVSLVEGSRQVATGDRMTSDGNMLLDREDEGSGAVCLLVLAVGALVFAVVLSLMAFTPEGHRLGAVLTAKPEPSASSVVSDLPR
jgi:hypothetical protein